MNAPATRLLGLFFFSLSATAFAQPGTLDPTFNGDGIQVLQPGTLHDVGHEVIALPDTTLLVCGVAFQGGAPLAFIGHLLQNGDVDTGYGTNGYTFFDSGEETYAYDMELAVDGSVYMCGTAYPAYPQQTIALFHVLADGTPDPLFGSGGIVITVITTIDAEAQDMALDADGKIVVAGRAGFGSTSNSVLLRYNPDGTPDNSFSGDGQLALSTYPNTEDMLYAVDILDDGSIVATGYADIIGDQKTILVKVDASGSPVASFGGDGVVVPGLNATADQGWAILADGLEFFVTGVHMDVQSDYDVYLAKFNDDGTYAAGYGTGGFTLINTAVNEYGFDLDQQSDGKVVLCGTSGQFGFGAARDFLMARFNTDGSPDAGFGNNGVVITSIQPDFDDANGCAIQPDGKIVSAGFTSGFNTGGDNDLALVRYESGSPLAIEDNTMSADMYAWPNPTSGPVRLSGLQADATNVRVFDAHGALLLSQPLRNGIIDLGSLEPGTYFLATERGPHIATPVVKW